MPFCATDLSSEIIRKLNRERYAWLTTVAPSGVFRRRCSPGFDGTHFTLYSPAHASRVAHVFERPEVSLHLESRRDRRRHRRRRRQGGGDR